MYPVETLDPEEDNGTMPNNVATLSDAVVGHRIASARQEHVERRYGYGYEEAFVITLDNGQRVVLENGGDCCAYTELQSFFLHPEAVDHVIMGVGTTDEYTTWHIYADFGDIMRLKVGWSAGNPFYYGYGFDIRVTELSTRTLDEIYKD